MAALYAANHPYGFVPYTNFQNMKIKSILSNIVLYGRSTWQIVKSRLQPKKGLNDILNYRYISDRLATSGQPTAEEFSLIYHAGYQTVLNLAPPNASNALPNEPAIVSGLGMDYINIPVVWDSPTLADFTKFCDVMQAHRERPIFVHCAMNMRVSAFVYLYRRLIMGVSEPEAYQLMTTIWHPNETWQQFIENAIASYSSSP